MEGRRETEDVVRRMREELDRIRGAAAAPPANPDPGAAMPVGTGEALGGQVHVAASGGKVTEVRLDPRVLRKPPKELGAAITAATNAALEDMRTAMAGQLPTPPSLDRLSATLRELSTESMGALRAAEEGTQRSLDAVRRISELHRRS